MRIRSRCAHDKDKEDPTVCRLLSHTDKTTTNHERKKTELLRLQPAKNKNRGQSQATYSCLITVSTASFIASATRCTVEEVRPAILIRPLLVM